MVKVNAIVCSYWKERSEHIPRIVTDLRQGTVVPDNIFVLNNNPDHQLSIDGAYVINSGYNFECRGKYAVSVLDVANYYLLLDDDTSVSPGTLEALLRWARDDSCFGYLGCYLDFTQEMPFHNGGRVWPYQVEEECAVDSFCGCAMFMSFKAVVNTLDLESLVRLDGKWPTEGDDIIAGLANRSSVVPMNHHERFVDLDWSGVAMYYRPGYVEMREEFLKAVLLAKESWRK